MALCARCTNDIHLQVRRVPFEKLASLDGGESSAAIRARVEAARKVQEARFAPLGKPNMLVNGDMGPAEVQQFCGIDEAGKSLMRAAVKQMELSDRAYHRVLKLGRTSMKWTQSAIADLADEEAIRDNAGNLAISVSVQPALATAKGHRIQLFLNGAPVGEPPSGSTETARVPPSINAAISGVISRRLVASQTPARKTLTNRGR